MINWYYRTNIKKSNIHGVGRFAAEIIKKNHLVCCIYGNIYKNENNSFVNHSKDNNLNWNGKNGWIANRIIYPNEEITMDYTQWIPGIKF